MQSIRKNTKREGIKERIILTLGLLILSRLGTFIPVPGVDHDAFYQSISSNPIVSFLKYIFRRRVCFNWNFCS